MVGYVISTLIKYNLKVNELSENYEINALIIIS